MRSRSDRLARWTGPQAAAGDRGEPLLGILFVVLLGLLLAVDAMTSAAVSVGALATLVALAAGWSLDLRWTVVVAAAGVAFEAAGAFVGAAPPVYAVSLSISVAATAAGAHAGSVAFASLRDQHRREVELLAQVADLVPGGVDLVEVLDRIITAATQTSARSLPAGRMQATLTRVGDDFALDDAPEAFRETLRTGAPTTARVPADGGGHRIWTYARVHVDGAPWGVLAVAAPPGLRGVVDADILNALANLAGLAIGRAVRQGELEALRDRLQVGLDLALTIGTSLDPREVTDAMLERAVASVHADRATLTWKRGDEGEIYGVVDREASGIPRWPGSRFPWSLMLAQPMVAEAVRTLRPVAGSSFMPEAALEDFGEPLRRLRQAASMPLVAAGRLIGVLMVSRRSDTPFSEDQLATLAQLAGVASLALQNALTFAEMRAAREREAVATRSLRLAIGAAQDVGGEDVGDVPRRLLARAIEAVRADRGAISHVDGEDLVVDWNVDLDGRHITSGTRLPLAVIPETAAILQARTPVWGAPLHWPLPRTGTGPQPWEGVVHSLQYPLMVGGAPVGLMTLSRRSDVPFRTEDAQELSQFASLAALLIRDVSLLAQERELNRAKSNFLNLAAHELRTPLSVVRGYVSLLRDGTLDPGSPSGEQGLRIVADKVEELLRLVEALLDTARLEAGRIRTERQVFDLRDVATAAVARAAPRAGLSSIRLQHDVPPAPVWVRADANSVGRVLDNLLNNALTYGNGQPIRVQVASGDGEGVVCVEDHGIGIPAAQQDRIFDRFYRVEGPYSGPTVGAGLGLSIGKDLAELNGGTLALLRSEPGVGSTFRLALPVADAPR